MDSLKFDDPTVADSFFAPLSFALDNYTRNTRECSGMTDNEFLKVGVQRVIEQAKSGRDYLQRLAEVYAKMLARSSFFDALHSQRRLGVIEEVSAQVYVQAERTLGSRDHLAAFPALAGRAILAVDGHQIEHAVHALRDKKGRRVAPGSVYALCLHSGLMRALCAFQGQGVHHHELPAFRQALPKVLPKGAKALPIIIGDPGYVDLAFWTLQKLQKKAVIITRTKANMKPLVYCGLPFDAADPVNQGVTAFEMVGFDNALNMRIIRYTDPETGTKYEFLTTDSDLPPGLIAFLYFLRWRIEKFYDTAKNKLQETKAWANGTTALEQQTHFIALAHNLLVLFLEKLRDDHGLTEQKVIQKRQLELAKRAVWAERKGHQLPPLLMQMPQPPQLTLQFIRCVRNLIATKVSYIQSIPRFRLMLFAYL